MQKFAIFTLAMTGLWIVAFGLPNRTVIAWQQPQTGDPEREPTTQPPPGEAVPEVANPPVDPAAAAEATSKFERARALLDGSAEDAYTSVDARLVQRASFGNRRFRAEGRYQSRALPQLRVEHSIPQLRVEYQIRVGESVGFIREICDGQILLTHKYIQAVGAAPDEFDPLQYQVSRKDVRRILQATEAAGTPPEAILRAELSLGGLPALLASIERSMEFESVQEQNYQGKPFFVIQSRWRQSYLQELDRDPYMQRVAGQIAPFMPSRVRVYLHHDTLFPERILYLQQATADPVTYHAIMSLEFVDVKLNEEVNPDTFRIRPPPEGVLEFDETDLYIQMIENHRKQQQAVASGSAAAQSGASPAPETNGDN